MRTATTITLACFCAVLNTPHSHLCEYPNMCRTRGVHFPLVRSHVIFWRLLAASSVPSFRFGSAICNNNSEPFMMFSVFVIPQNVHLLVFDTAWVPHVPPTLTFTTNCLSLQLNCGTVSPLFKAVAVSAAWRLAGIRRTAQNGCSDVSGPNVQPLTPVAFPVSTHSGAINSGNRKNDCVTLDAAA